MIKTISMVLIGLTLSTQALCRQSKKDIQKINNTLIFDLFINYELTEKNGNIATIIDFSPKMENNKYKIVKLKSNIGGTNQVCEFNFNDSQSVESITYEVNNKRYEYDLIYTENRLTDINIAGKPKINFGYDKKGRLTTITRQKSGVAFEYNFEYIKGEDKADLKLIVVQGESRRPSNRKYYATWNNNLNLESYCLDVYCSKSIKYTSQEDVLSFSFESVDENNNGLTWEYSAMDSYKNWTERKRKDIVFNRSIEYR